MTDRMSDIARLVGEKAQLNALVEQLADTARVALELQMAAEARADAAERALAAKVEG